MDRLERTHTPASNARVRLGDACACTPSAKGSGDAYAWARIRRSRAPPPPASPQAPPPPHGLDRTRLRLRALDRTCTHSLFTLAYTHSRLHTTLKDCVPSLPSHALVPSLPSLTPHTRALGATRDSVECVVPRVWCRVCGAMHRVCGAKCVTRVCGPIVWCQASSVWCEASRVLCQASSVRRQLCCAEKACRVTRIRGEGSLWQDKRAGAVFGLNNQRYLLNSCGDKAGLRSLLPSATLDDLRSRDSQARELLLQVPENALRSCDSQARELLLQVSENALELT